MRVETRLKAEDYEDVAEQLVNRHGPKALLWADLAIDDLESQGEFWRADAWRIVRTMILDLTADRFTGLTPLTVQ